MESISKRGLAVLKKILIMQLLVLSICALTFIIAGKIPDKNPVTPAGYHQMQSTYLTMKDGTQIAIRIAFPYDLQTGEKVPTIVECTRYGTYKKSFILNALLNLRIAKEKPNIFYETLLKSKYASVRIDARGSGASFGKREMEWSKEEIEDIEEVIDWIVNQSWSNKKVGTYGISYSGNTAELAVAFNNSALLAAAPLFADFDPIRQVGMPGGIYNEVLIKEWHESNIAIDSNQKGLFIDGIAPVDEDKKERLLKMAVDGHQTLNVYERLKRITYYDDTFAGKYKANSLALYNYKNEIQESEVPLYVRVGWQDAGTVNGAIERFLTYNNNQTLIIGPWSHGGSYFYDPFMKNPIAQEGIIKKRIELEKAQAEEIIKFFDTYLKEEIEHATDENKKIIYYTFGEGEWKTTNVWPVPGFDNKIFYFDFNRSLNESRPTHMIGKDIYEIDFTASTGESNRWFTNIGGGPIFYPNRVEEDQKLLTYTSEPFENDVEITGVPVVTLNVSSTATDGAFYVYLEDVASDGTVTYITEGELRALHRNLSEEDLGYTVLGPKHSFLKSDGELLKPGEIFEIKIGMYATSVLIKKGHRIRIGIAGHDAANFDRIPKDEIPIIEVQRNAIFSSYVELPLKARE